MVGFCFNYLLLMSVIRYGFNEVYVLRGVKSPRVRTNATRCAKDGVDRGVRPVKELADLVQGIACLPAIPHQRFLSFGVVNPRSLLYTNTPSA